MSHHTAAEQGALRLAIAARADRRTQGNPLDSVFVGAVLCLRCTGPCVALCVQTLPLRMAPMFVWMASTPRVVSPSTVLRCC